MNWTHNIKITNEDNMALMARYPDDHFDLAIVDPPYGLDWMKQIQNPNTKANWKKYKNKDWDKGIPNKEYFEQLFRVSKNQIIWGGNYMLENLHSTPCFIIWDKMQEFTGAVFEMAWTSFKSPSKAFRMSRVEAYTTNVKIHPTQKPIKLYKWILQNYAKEGDLILDTHLGSGSIAIACHQMGFDLVGCELDADYYKAAHKRFKQQTAQMRLAI
jgi:site-specific DNA-methyltransferase (adenine-specific)